MDLSTGDEDKFDLATKINCTINTVAFWIASTPGTLNQIAESPFLFAFQTIAASALWARVGTLITGTGSGRSWESYTLFNGAVIASSYILIRRMIPK